MKRLIIFMGVAATLSFMSFAQDSSEIVRKISIDDAVVLAAENNISLKRQKITLDTLERRNKTSWNGISPSVSLSGRWSKSLDGIVTDYDAPDGYNYSVGADVNLSLTPSLYTSIVDAKIKYEAGKVAYEEAERQVELSVRKLFYSLLYSQESINLQKRNMETARLRYENNRDKYNRGQLSELDLLQSQYSYESQRPAIESAEISYQNSLASFKQTLGIPQNEKIELEGALEANLPTAELKIGKTVDDLFSIKKLKAGIVQQKNSLLSTRFSAYAPSITASYAYSLAGSNETKDLKSHKETQTITLGVRIPLDGMLPWSTGALSVANQKSNLKDLELQLENERTTLELNLQNSIKNIELKQNQMQLLNRNVEIAQKTYDMTLAAYNHGSRDLLTLQNASDALMKAKLDRQSHIYNLICAIFDLENTLGLPFGTLGKE